ncbi:hypothetical protein BAMA_19980 [Bacillus manliponensis]|uniref:2'-5' RNA ligase n=1 Tax=Bacillus manliponensis TaxID=574376 RepID=A0A073K0G4_9BACI|nr:2'-5' RNA ligase family protein [Bacillus manliponensis]KEK20036.1 hypothetical protein BAMA_19980 [Bacillus manliponensis]
MYAVIATFDEKTTNRVKEIWKQIEKFTGVSMEGLDPHITFADYHHIDEKSYLQKLKQFTKRTSAFSVVFSSIGMFPSTGTIFLAPVVTKELQDVHRSFHEYFGDFLDNEQSYYVPDQWVPHCTIASRLDKNQSLRILEHMYGKFRVEQAALQTIKVIKVTYENNEPAIFETIGEYSLKEKG